ncbi:hypothetical protein FOA52_006723 [Chlamydomonas sp. UWO 241]|nr:hypothetical protein FOA52_006723 [Chlamydomonas sp. UWO 241]
MVDDAQSGLWSRHDDRLLSEAQARLGNKWTQIAAQLPGKTSKQCSQRWRQCVAADAIKRRWLPAEDARLAQLVAEHGQENWSAVSDELQGRSQQACMGRWRQLDPSRKGAWDPREDERLASLVARLGHAWTAMSNTMPGRTPQQCRARWVKLRGPASSPGVGGQAEQRWAPPDEGMGEQPHPHAAGSGSVTPGASSTRSGSSDAQSGSGGGHLDDDADSRPASGSASEARGECASGGGGGGHSKPAFRWRLRTRGGGGAHSRRRGASGGVAGGARGASCSPQHSAAASGGGSVAGRSGGGGGGSPRPRHHSVQPPQLVLLHHLAGCSDDLDGASDDGLGCCAKRGACGSPAFQVAGLSPDDGGGSARHDHHYHAHGHTHTTHDHTYARPSLAATAALICDNNNGGGGVTAATPACGRAHGGGGGGDCPASVVQWPLTGVSAAGLMSPPPCDARLASSHLHSARTVLGWRGAGGDGCAGTAGAVPLMQRGPGGCHPQHHTLRHPSFDSCVNVAGDGGDASAAAAAAAQGKRKAASADGQPGGLLDGGSGGEEGLGESGAPPECGNGGGGARIPALSREGSDAAEQRSHAGGSGGAAAATASDPHSTPRSRVCSGGGGAAAAVLRTAAGGGARVPRSSAGSQCLSVMAPPLPAPPLGSSMSLPPTTSGGASRLAVQPHAPHLSGSRDGAPGSCGGGGGASMPRAHSMSEWSDVPDASWSRWLQKGYSMPVVQCAAPADSDPSEARSALSCDSPRASERPPPLAHQQQCGAAGHEPRRSAEPVGIVGQSVGIPTERAWSLAGTAPWEQPQPWEQQPREQQHRVGSAPTTSFVPPPGNAAAAVAISAGCPLGGSAQPPLMQLLHGSADAPQAGSPGAPATHARARRGSGEALVGGRGASPGAPAAYARALRGSGEPGGERGVSPGGGSPLGSSAAGACARALGSPSKKVCVDSVSPGASGGGGTRSRTLGMPAMTGTSLLAELDAALGPHAAAAQTHLPHPRERSSSGGGGPHAGVPPPLVGGGSGSGGPADAVALVAIVPQRKLVSVWPHAHASQQAPPPQQQPQQQHARATAPPAGAAAPPAGAAALHPIPPMAPPRVNSAAARAFRARHLGAAGAQQPATPLYRPPAAAEVGTSLPARLTTDVVRFLHGGTGRREPADGGVASASLLNAKPAVGGIGVEPRGGGVLRVLFTVASDAVADTVVRWRHELRRCVDSTAVFDVLSDREEAQHQALWPAFLAAKVAGKRAQFHRARLVVDGERVPAPAC